MLREQMESAQKYARTGAPILLGLAMLQFILATWIRSRALEACIVSIAVSVIAAIYAGIMFIAFAAHAQLFMLFAMVLPGLYIGQFFLLINLFKRLNDPGFTAMPPGMNGPVNLQLNNPVPMNASMPMSGPAIGGMSPPMSPPLSMSPMMLPNAHLILITAPDDISPDQNPYHVQPVGTINEAQSQTGWKWTIQPPPPPPNISSEEKTQ